MKMNSKRLLKTRLIWLLVLLCYNSIRKRKEVGNNMNTLTYRCLGDHRTYVLTCNDESLDLYIKLFFENDVYKVNLNDELEFTSYADYELWKNEKK